MKKILIGLLVLSVCFASEAQEKTKRQERMEQWKKDMAEFAERSANRRRCESIIDSLTWCQAKDAMGEMAFVLEADAVTFRDGTRVIVDESVNFISVNGDHGVVQISPSRFYSGPNGMGGITLKGSVSSYESKTDKRGNLHVTMNIIGVAINAVVDITFYNGSDKAYAIVSPNFGPGRVRLEGQIKPYGISRTIEGISTY